VKSATTSTAPGLFIAGGIPRQSQAVAFANSPIYLAALPTFWYPGAPVFAGGPLTLIGTGVACGPSGARPKIRVGDQFAAVLSLASSPDVGECAITVQLPESVYGDFVPVLMESLDPDGRPVESNRVFVAIESRR
jgi:hypothetical protein